MPKLKQDSSNNDKSTKNNDNDTKFNKLEKYIMSNTAIIKRKDG